MLYCYSVTRDEHLALFLDWSPSTGSDAAPQTWGGPSWWCHQSHLGFGQSNFVVIVGSSVFFLCQLYSCSSFVPSVFYFIFFLHLQPVGILLVENTLQCDGRCPGSWKWLFTMRRLLCICPPNATNADSAAQVSLQNLTENSLRTEMPTVRELVSSCRGKVKLQRLRGC